MIVAIEIKHRQKRHAVAQPYPTSAVVGCAIYAEIIAKVHYTRIGSVDKQVIYGNFWKVGTNIIPGGTEVGCLYNKRTRIGTFKQVKCIPVPGIGYQSHEIPARESAEIHCNILPTVSPVGRSHKAYSTFSCSYHDVAGLHGRLRGRIDWGADYWVGGCISPGISLVDRLIEFLFEASVYDLRNYRVLPVWTDESNRIQNTRIDQQLPALSTVGTSPKVSAVSLKKNYILIRIIHETFGAIANEFKIIWSSAPVVGRNKSIVLCS